MEKRNKFLIGGIIVLALILTIILFGKFTGDTKESKRLSNDTSGTLINENGKIDFFIETKSGKDFGGDAFLEKTGKVISQEDISISSQANGEVSRISVKEGQKIAKGQKLISLTDSIGAYGLNLEKTKLGVQSAEIDYNSQKINLNKSVSDATINLEKTKNNSKNSRKSLDQNIAQAELALVKSRKDLEDTKKLVEQLFAQATLTLGSSKNVSEDTTLALQIQKLENSIAKTELDVENSKKSNIEQLKTFKNSTLSSYKTLNDLIIDLIDFSDQILGVTPQNKRLNDKFELYLGKKDTIQLEKTKRILNDFLVFKSERFDILDLDNKDFDQLSLEEYEAIFLTGDEGYRLAEELLSAMTGVFDNSIPSLGSLSQADIDTYKNQVNGYESQTSSLFSGYLTFKGQVRTFLNTYKNSEKSLEENLKLLQDEIVILEKNKVISDSDFDTALKTNKINFEKTKIDNQKTITLLENAVKNNEINLKKLKIEKQKTLVDLDIALKEGNIRFENTKQVRNITLQKMQNNIDISNNTKKQAAKEYGKLSSTSPIFGVVTEILIDEGQDVSIGTPLMSISSLDNTEIEISLSEEESKTVSVGDEVFVYYEGKKIDGKIESISAVANENLSYKTKIVFSEKFKTIGGLIDIIIPVKIESILFPINIIEVTGEGKGKIKTMSGGTVVNYDIGLGKVWGDAIEITTPIDKDTQFITTNISNYDSNRFELKIRGQEDEYEKEKSDIKNDSKKKNDTKGKKEMEKNKEDLDDEFEGR